MKRATTISVLLPLMTFMSVVAQSESPLALVLKRSLVNRVQVEGQWVDRLTPNPETLKPGDILLEQVEVTNRSERALGKVTVDVPVPVGREGERITGRAVYQNGTATPAGTRWSLQFSFDGGKTFGEEPRMKKVQVKSGQQMIDTWVKVLPEEYTHVRWIIEKLSPKEVLTFGFKAQLK
ncbi:MAG: hypothetical protein U0Z75_05000 [Deinococcaceae bacterium]